MTDTLPPPVDQLIVPMPRPRSDFFWENSTPNIGSKGPGDRDGGLVYYSLPYYARPQLSFTGSAATLEAMQILEEDMNNIWDFFAHRRRILCPDRRSCRRLHHRL